MTPSLRQASCLPNVAKCSTTSSAISTPPKTYAIPGWGTNEGCTIAGGVPLSSGSGWSNGSDIYVIWSTTHGSAGRPSGTSLPYAHANVDANGLFKFVITSQTSGQQYFASLSRTDGTTLPAVWVGDPIAFKPFPDPDAIEGTFTIKWAYGSCQYWHGHDDAFQDANGNPLQKAWTDLKEWQPDILWETGDFHYRGGLYQNFGSGPASDWVTWADMFWQQLHGLLQSRPNPIFTSRTRGLYLPRL
jgi:hypothetical protein